MARRGFLALLHHQARVVARERAAAERTAARERDAAVRRAEQARRAAERAQEELAGASAQDRRHLEKETREAHVEAMEAEALRRNLELASVYDEIESLLAATLGVDDFIDLDTLRIVPKHPPFSEPSLEQPLLPPKPYPIPAQPVFVPPPEPTGLASVFGKKKHAELMAQATEAHEHALRAWRVKLADLAARRQADLDAHGLAEAERVKSLVAARELYFKECARREEEATGHNRQLDEMITNLSYGAAGAVEEYVSLVLSNSVYPEHFPIRHDFEFDPSSAELKLRVVIPGPQTSPEIKAYKYTKATDAITSTELSQKACRDRYASALHQVALRSFHEVFECDRRGVIKTIALEVGTETVDPATGKQIYVPFVVAAADRGTFLGFELAAVVPLMTLERLGAAISKNPYGLVPVATKGIRRS